MHYFFFKTTEAATGVSKMFLEILQNSQENTCATVERRNLLLIYMFKLDSITR